MNIKQAATERGVDITGMQMQMQLTEAMCQLATRIMAEIDALPSLTLMQVSSYGDERPAVHPLVGTVVAVAKVAQSSLKACGLNNDAKDKKPAEQDTLGEFLGELGDE